MKKNSDRHLYRIPKKVDNSKNYCKLIIVIVMSVIFIGGQIFGGVISHSISVISDATHLITDLVGFIVSFVFLYYSDKASNKKNSFGFHRMEVVGALANLFIIWCIAIFLLYEATVRIINKEFVDDPKVMLIVAGGGLAVNIVMYFVLHTGQGGHSHGLGQKCEHDNPEQEVEVPLCKACHQPEDKSHKCTNPNEMLNDENPQRRKKSNESGSAMELKNDLIEMVGNESRTQCSNEQCQSQEHTHAHRRKKGSPKKHAHEHHEHGPSCSHNHDHVHSSPHKQQHRHDQTDQHQHQHEDGKPCSHNHGVVNDNKKPQSPSKNKVAPMMGNELEQHAEHSYAGKCTHDHGNGHAHDHEHDHDHNQGHTHGHNHHHDHDDGEVNQNKDSISMRAAVLHALTDIIQSIGLLISALVIFFVGSNNGAKVTEFNGWHYLDPITTYVFCVLVILSTWPITKQCYYIILESTPEQIDSQKIHDEFEKLKGVMEVHDFHVWELRPSKFLLTAHVFSDKNREKYVLHELTTICRRYKIYHTTIQVEEWDQRQSDSYILCDNDIH